MNWAIKLEPSYRHIWVGCYWETCGGKSGSRTDIWFAVPFIALRIIIYKGHF